MRIIGSITFADVTLRPLNRRRATMIVYLLLGVVWVALLMLIILDFLRYERSHPEERKTFVPDDWSDTGSAYHT
jgi:hypothetical protein